MNRLSLLVVGVATASVSLSAQQWPSWRGGDGTGLVQGADLPLAWSEAAGVSWRTRLVGTGVSTPVATGGRVFVTSQVGRGERRQGNHPSLVQGADAATAGERNLTGTAEASALTFVVAAYAADTGRPMWERRVAAAGPMPALHDKHNMASPSPVADESVVVAWFGTGQVVAYTPEGDERWSRHLGLEYGAFDIQWGHASSPALYGDTLVLVCYHASQSYVLALDKMTGRVRWKVDRAPGVLSYSTPLVIDTAAGPEVIINASTGLEAVALADGALRWQVRDENRFPIPVATRVGDTLLTTRGYRSGPYYAIRLGGRGDVTDSHVVWRIPTGAPYISSLVHVDGLIFAAGELGIVTCLDAATGERVWQERVGGIFTASPIASSGRIYLLSETGETVVLAASRTFEVLARNRLDAHFVASPIAVDGRLILRADNELIAVGR
ncbi:MAG TPA: PQQ-binding-like beta-propeller repeat protein [Vicinamibacterales bacterium]|nr:PQQ-binding-like beta-propeller repeat protein [Vicinamibacterales bacterium]